MARSLTRDRLRIDAFLPQYTVSERHTIQVAAPPARVFPVARHLDFNASRITRTLFRMRGLPAEDLRLDALLGEGPGFTILEERPPEEFVIGLMTHGARPIGIESPEAFHAFAPAQGLRIAWNFHLRPSEAGTLVSTETRVQCLGRTTRCLFLLYWLAIRPFSGWIRREMLRILKRRAEAD